MEKTPQRARLIDPSALRGFVESEAGRATVRRELVEGAQVKSGQHALILCDAKPTEMAYLEIQVVGDTLRDLGLQVTTMQVDELIPPFPGSVPVTFAYVERHRLPKLIYAAILEADITFNLTSTGRGAQRYNSDFYTLSTYYGKQIDGGRTVEAPEVIGTDDDPQAPNLDCILYPSDLLRVIGDAVNDVLITAAERREEFQLTNSWGTDLRFTVLPGDIAMPAGGIRRYPCDDLFRGEDNRWLYRALAGFNVTQTCEGTWVTKDITIVGGDLDAPIRVRIENGFLVGAEGGQDAERFMKVLSDEPAGVHAILVGLNPKLCPFRKGQYLTRNHGVAAGVAHIGVGSPGLYFRGGEWGGVGNKHFELGNIPKVSLRAGERWVFKDGRLLALSDPAVRSAAAKFGDPDQLLTQFSWPEVPLS